MLDFRSAPKTKILYMTIQWTFLPSLVQISFVVSEKTYNKIIFLRSFPLKPMKSGAQDRQFLLHTWYLSCYSCYKSGVKSWTTSIAKIIPPLPTYVQPISITKTLLIVPTKNEKDPPLFTGKLLIKFQNILRNATQVIIRHRVKSLFSVISSPITLERQKWKSSKKKGILLSSPVNSW